MFSCGQCGKQYASRGTLTRHQRNHDSTQAVHHCHECDVSFRRSDLLTRHQRIHKALTNGDQPARSSQRARQRCHTACEACQTQRIRCSGGQPCQSCFKASRDCVYRAGLGRYSQRTMDNVAAAGQSVNIEMTDGHLWNYSDQPVHAILERSGTNQEQPLHAAETLSAFSSSIVSDDVDDTFWGFSTGWQWTHEELFLQQGPAWDDTCIAAPPIDPELPSLEFPSDECSNASLLLPSNHAYTSLAPLNPATPQEVRQNTGRQLRDIEVVRATLCTVVASMVNRASNYHKTVEPGEWDGHARSLSRLISTRVGAEAENQESHLLRGLVEQYFEHFHPLWPCIPPEECSLGTFHPLLYLTLTAIGALYSGTKAAAAYGSLMHTKIRETLLHLRFDHTSELQALDIGRTMLLTQVTALYFEQNGAFSTAQRLGAALNDHARRMRLFSSRMQRSSTETIDQTTRKLLQGRKMLAFGILRGETFMSILFNKKPLISYEEINISLPAPDLEAKHDLSVRTQAGISRAEMRFSDLVRIALDEEEILPALGPWDIELLLFGLQHEVWRFSHDPDLFPRLTKAAKPSIHATPRNIVSTQDYLDCTGRRMGGLTADYTRTIKALVKWKQAFTHSQLSNHCLDLHRSTYLSALILYELSQLRLCAPLDSIQQIAYGLHEPGAYDPETTAQVIAWSRTPEALEAVQHARSSWQLLSAETLRPSETQAKYNILALIALHHAAAVVWVVAGTEGLKDQSFLTDGSEAAARTLLRRRNTQHLMLTFADIYPKITSTWGMQSSFAKMVRTLADHPFVTNAQDVHQTSAV